MAVAEVDYLNGGGKVQPIDYSYLPNSTKANVLASKNLGLAKDGGITLSKGYVELSGANTNVTCYLYGKAGAVSGSEAVFFAVPYASSNGNAPNFLTGTSYAVTATIYGSGTTISGVSSNVNHVYAISINASTKKARYFVDGVYQLEKTFTNSGAYVIFGALDKASVSFSTVGFETDYFGVVAECESDVTIIANMQTIMAKMS